MGDFALIWDPALGAADMALLDDDVQSDEGLRTAVLLSLFTDRRANDDDPLPSEDHDVRGWWGDEFLPDADDRIGSRLWLLDRSTITPDLRSRAEDYIREALDWMLQDGVALSVGVETELVGDSLYYLVTIDKPDESSSTFRFEHVWTGEAENVDPYPIAALADDAYDIVTEAGTTIITEAGDTLAIEAAP